MADNEIQQQWMTNFYYGQELRSLYMNGALNSGFRPGIYNASMAVYAKNGPESGLYLFIKKGTTFIFSNNYIKEHDRIKRDLNGINSDYSTLIKTVALDDITIKLIALGANSTSAGPILGTAGSANASPARRFYIVSSMIYSPDPDDNKGVVSNGVPRFELYLDNPDFVEELDENVDENNFYYKPAEASAEGAELFFRIPDGSKNYKGKEDKLVPRYSYLFCGAVIDKTAFHMGGAFSKGYIDQQQKWTAGDGSIPPGDVLWTNNHFFTARGFEDYRQSFTDTREVLSPDLILTDDTSEIYFDARNAYVDNMHFNTIVNREDVHNIPLPKDKRTGIGSQKIPQDSKNRYIVYKLDHEVKYENANSENLTYEKDIKDLRDTLNKKKAVFTKYPKPEGPIEGQEMFLLADALFLCARDKFSNMPENALMHTFNENYGTTENRDLLNKIFNRKLKLVPFQWVSNCSFSNLDPTQDKEYSHITNDVRNENYSSMLHQRILPLDVGVINQQRLLSIVNNRNILPVVLDYMRLHESESPYLGPDESSSLIPAAIIFRKFEVIRREPIEGEDPDYKPIDRLIGVDSISEAPQKLSLESPVTQGIINPANILCFFDFQFNTNIGNKLDFSSDSYSVIPVIK